MLAWAGPDRPGAYSAMMNPRGIPRGRSGWGRDIPGLGSWRARMRPSKSCPGVVRGRPRLAASRPRCQESTQNIVGHPRPSGLRFSYSGCPARSAADAASDRRSSNLLRWVKEWPDLYLTKVTGVRKLLVVGTVKLTADTAADRLATANPAALEIERARSLNAPQGEPRNPGGDPFALAGRGERMELGKSG